MLPSLITHFHFSFSDLLSEIIIDYEEKIVLIIEEYEVIFPFYYGTAMSIAKVARDAGTSQ